MTIYHKKHAMNIAATLNGLARMCYKISSEHGFHEDDQTVKEIIEDATQISVRRKQEIIQWFSATTEQAEIARMHSELSEWLETIRTDPARLDDHLPEFENAAVEAADCIIRILDTCAKRAYPIGPALLAKMEYNNSRPHKHGKNS